MLKEMEKHFQLYMYIVQYLFFWIFRDRDEAKISLISVFFKAAKLNFLVDIHLLTVDCETTTRRDFYHSL
jgi:hypothetical protein